MGDFKCMYFDNHCFACKNYVPVLRGQTTSCMRIIKTSGNMATAHYLDVFLFFNHHCKSNPYTILAPVEEDFQICTDFLEGTVESHRLIITKVT